MKRREFAALLGGATVWPLLVYAQQPERMRRIGVLSGSAESDVKDWLTAFKAELQKRGWEQGGNIQIDYRFGAGDNDRLGAYAAELVEMAPDVLFAVTATSLVALHRQTSTVPIVFAQVGDPVKLGVVASLAHPGGNITGFAIAEHATSEANGLNCSRILRLARPEWRSYPIRRMPITLPIWR